MNLDTFKGSSGSPVFNEATGLIEGIVSKGEPKDFIEARLGACSTIRRCGDTECRGEVVTRASEFSAAIP